MADGGADQRADDGDRGQGGDRVEGGWPGRQIAEWEHQEPSTISLRRSSRRRPTSAGTSVTGATRADLLGPRPESSLLRAASFLARLDLLTAA